MPSTEHTSVCKISRLCDCKSLDNFTNFKGGLSSSVDTFCLQDQYQKLKKNNRWKSEKENCYCQTLKVLSCSFNEFYIADA